MTSRRRDEAPPRPLMDTVETAVYLKIGKKTLENWRSLGEGPPYLKLGGRVRYDPRDLDQWLKKQTVGAA